MITRQCTYLYASRLLNSTVFRCFLNVSFSSTVLMSPGILFQLMGPWYTNARCPYDFGPHCGNAKDIGSDNERSGLAGVYTFNSSDRYFGYAVVNAVWHRESLL